MAAKLTQEQENELRKEFEILDKDGDGTITSVELGTLMRSLGLTPSQEELDQMIRSVDGDGNGTIDFEEFVKMMRETTNKQSDEDALREAFKTFDKDGDGYVTIEELRQVLKNLGEQLTEEEVEEMIGCVDFTGEGRVSCEDFIKNMMTT